jgi:hypothetical protein
VEAFLRRVLPDGGKYVVVSIAGESGAREIRGLPDIPAAVSAAQRLSQYKTNVYFAVGTYGADRKQPVAKRALFVDLDPKGYPTKQEQLQALSAWCRATAFPPPSIYVDSGHGIHAYWCFDRDMPVAEWRPLAEALKKRCLEADLKIDPTVTADAARILRMPGTMNVKGETPLACRVLKDTGVSYDPSALLKSLSPVLSSSLAALAGMVGAGDLGTAPEASSYPQVPYYATEIAEKCGVLKEALASGGHEHTEPQWRHLLSLLTFTEDGDKLVHDISKGHVGYTPSSTDAKYAAVLQLKRDGKLKPILCTTFAGYKGSICAACPYNGNIKTPMVLGKIEATSFLPHGYRMADYSVQKMIKKGDGEVPDLWVDVFPYRISDVETLDPGSDRALHVRMLLSSKKHVTKFTYEHMLMFMQGSEFNQELAKARLWATPTQLNEFKSFMTTWLRKMTDIKTSVSIELTGLGWGKRGGKHAFVAGPSVYTEDAKEYDFHPPDPAMLRNYKPKGVIDPWKTAAIAIAKDPRQAAVCTLLTAFAAPLVNFTGVKGLAYSLYSAESGTGKSSILRTAQAVWGHPTLGMAMVDDTQLSVINKLGFLNTIPAYWDELRSGDALVNFVKMIFTLGQGREKARLTSSIKQQSTGTWDTLITIASNERIADHVDQYIKNTDAGRLRLFEVSLPMLLMPDPLVTRAFSRLEANYGHAGIIYGAYLATHRSEAEQLVHAYQDYLKKRISPGSAERFWVAFISAILAAATLVERAGLLNINKPKLTAWLLEQVQAQKTGVDTNYKTPADAALSSVISFIDCNRDHMLLVEEFNGTGMNKYGNILTPQNQQPRGEIHVLKAVKDKIIRLKHATWKTFVTNVLKHSPSTLELELVAIGVKVTKAGMSGNVEQSSNARVKVLEIDLTTPTFAKLLDAE